MHFLLWIDTQQIGKLQPPLTNYFRILFCKIKNNSSHSHPQCAHLVALFCSALKMHTLHRCKPRSNYQIWLWPNWKLCPWTFNALISETKIELFCPNEFRVAWNFRGSSISVNCSKSYWNPVLWRTCKKNPENHTRFFTRHTTTRITKATWINNQETKNGKRITSRTSNMLPICQYADDEIYIVLGCDWTPAAGPYRYLCDQVMIAPYAINHSLSHKWGEGWKMGKRSPYKWNCFLVFSRFVRGGYPVYHV